MLEEGLPNYYIKGRVIQPFLLTLLFENTILEEELPDYYLRKGQLTLPLDPTISG